MSINKREIVILTIFFVSLITFWVIGFNYNIFNSNKDNADYALMGRQLVEGKGFSTLQIFPKHIPYLKSKRLLDNENWPNLYRYPLPIVLNALTQLIMGGPIKSAIVLSGVLILLGVFFIFLIVNKTTGFYQGIFVASIFFIDSLIAGYSGMSEPIAAVLLIVIVFFLIVPEDKIVFYALTGIFSGLLLLARTQYLFFIVLILLYYFHSKRSWKKILVYLLLIILTITPWLIRN